MCRPPHSRYRRLLNAFRRLISLDHHVQAFFKRPRNAPVDFFFRGVTHAGDGALWLVIYLLLLIFFRQQTASILPLLISGELIASALVICLRYATRRHRPDPRYRTFALTPWNRYSFPSHHSLRVFFLATLVGRAHPAFLPFFLGLALIVGFSRIYLSKHYLSDVVTGAGIGVLIAMLVTLLPAIMP